MGTTRGQIGEGPHISLNVNITQMIVLYIQLFYSYFVLPIDFF